MARAARIFLLLAVAWGTGACSYRVKPEASSAGGPDNQRFTTPDEVEKPMRRSAPAGADGNAEALSQNSSSMSADPNMEGGAGAAAAAPRRRASPVDARDSQKARVRRVILSRRLDIRACYMRAFGVEQHKGVLVYEWEYNEHGRVLAVQLVSSDFQQPKFERCVEQVIRNMHFPSSPGKEMNLKIRYPFEFR